MMSVLKTTECERYREFAEYFKELDNLGVSWGLSDLKEKSAELGLPILR